MTRVELLTALGVPEWLLTRPQNVWVRLGGRDDPFPRQVRRLGEPNRTWKVQVLDTEDPVRAHVLETWTTGEDWVDGVDDEAGPGPSWNSRGGYRSYREHSQSVHLSRLFQTWEEARGGWPLPGDEVICDIPSGTLRTKIVRCANPENGAYMFEVTGGQLLPVGCMNAVDVRAK